MVDNDIFLCGRCKTNFTSLVLFLEHKKSPCEMKATLFNNNISHESATSIHGNNISSTNQYLGGNGCEETNKVYCNICQKPFRKYKSLEVHRKIHTGERAFQCPICGRCFVQSTHLQRHLCSHKVWPSNISDTAPKTTTVDLLSYSCPYCDAILSNHNQYRVHLKKHTPIKKFKCIQGDCANLYDDIDILLDHISCNHKMETSYLCHLCARTFSSLNDIASHQQEHSETVSKEITKYKCLHCDAAFTKRAALSLHMSTDDHKKSCIHCNKTFVSDKRLRLHLQIHRKIMPFHCNLCGASFRMKKYLTTHMLKHGERQFVCTICNFKFKRSDLLNRHLRTHQSIKKLKCPFRDKLGCRMEFTRRDKLNLHINYHTNRMTVVANKEKKPKFKQGSTIEILIVPITNMDNGNNLE